MKGGERMASLFENIRLRVSPNSTKKTQLPLTSEPNTLGDLVNALDGTSFIDVTQFNKFRTLAQDRESSFKQFDIMKEDAIIAAALDIYADDATQYDSNGRVIWVESSEPDIAAFGNRLIEMFNLDRDAWSQIKSLCTYGELFLETFTNKEFIEDKDPLSQNNNTLVVKRNAADARLKEYIRFVPNPAELYDLQKFGKCVGYVRVPVTGEEVTQDTFGYKTNIMSYKTEILPPNKFIHIVLNQQASRYPETLSISIGDDDGTTTDAVDNMYCYDVKTGQSILKDVYKIYKEVSLMEDTLLLNRVTKSSIVRLIQVEVGDMPKTQARELLKRVKMLIEQKNFMDRDAQTYQSMASPGPVENCVYLPTHGGIGAITASTLGGDVDVKSIADLEYYQNKLYGALKIPKQFLGNTDDAAGFSGGSSLTKLDARYARTIKRIQNAYIQGIQTLINLFCIDKGLLDYVNNFTVKMTPPNTTEESDRVDALASKIGNANDIYSFATSIDSVSEDAKREMLVNLLGEYLGLDKIADIVQQDAEQQQAPEESEEEGMEDFGDDFGADFGGGPSGGGGFGGGPSGPSDFESFESENEAEAPSSAEEEFGNFESVMDNDEEYI